MRYGIFTPVVIAAVAWTVTTSGAQAQMWHPSTQVDVPRAIELEREADIAKSDPDQWTRVASLLRQASRLRPGNDPIAFVNLQSAGVIYGTVGKFEPARSTFLELASRAISFGEVEAAAHAFIDVTHVAVELGDVPAARSYYERAQRLSNSSHLSSEEQQSIVMRLEPSTTLMATSSP